MGWSNWEDLGGTISSAPAASSWGSKRLDVFARGPDGAMWHQWFDSGWKGWESLGHPMHGVLKEAPAAVSWGDDRVDCFIRTQNDSMAHRYWNGEKWSGWEDH